MISLMQHQSFSMGILNLAVSLSTLSVSLSVSLFLPFPPLSLSLFFFSLSLLPCPRLPTPFSCIAFALHLSGVFTEGPQRGQMVHNRRLAGPHQSSDSQDVQLALPLGKTFPTCCSGYKNHYQPFQVLRLPPQSPPLLAPS